MKRTAIHITDHAVLRYIERVKGIDVAAIRRDIAKTVAVADDHETCSAVTLDGFRYVLTNGALVTIKRCDTRKYRKKKSQVSRS